MDNQNNDQQARGRVISSQQQGYQQSYPQQPQAAQPTPPPAETPWRILDKRMIIPLIIIIFLTVCVIVGTYIYKSSQSSVEEVPASEKASVPEEVAADEAVVDTPELDELSFLEQQCPALDVRGDYLARDKCLFELAKVAKRVLLCNRMSVKSGPVSIDACYEIIAVYNKNEKYCDYMDAYYGENSYHSCVQNVAKATGNPYLCFTLTEDAGLGGNYTKIACLAQLNLTKERFKEIYGVEVP